MENIVNNSASSALQDGVPETDSKKQGVNKYKVLTFGLFVIVIILVPLIICGKYRPSTQYFCPDGWIGFQKNCYYFSKQEGDWNSSRHNCSTQHADLTVIDSREEMDFLRQHRCIFDLWIGLEMTENQTGTWLNGGIFNKWFDVRGNEKCAYLSDDGVATARCYTERKWICRKKKSTT
ncbi:PREDICTED: C-type lectin domain family 2 member B [Myotis davidii]|uniref:C-type lectin domain family 2 member B n=1 Tax=Myotis davidii TaxID=225400 RepID=UPI0003EC0251|nr:PREDICTED: C-type lectin domain family 2 member B [Myotis davidii]